MPTLRLAHESNARRGRIRSVQLLSFISIEEGPLPLDPRQESAMCLSPRVDESGWYAANALATAAAWRLYWTLCEATIGKPAPERPTESVRHTVRERVFMAAREGRGWGR